jgi:Zn-dependent M28 family amino/carboxypeptidase
VLQLTKAGYDRLLDSTGRTREELHDSPPALPLGMNVLVVVPLSAPATVQSANVLAVLPGADPELAQQVIVVGAHYDHVGDDPPDEQGAFLRYPGANDDASGVAVLLEMARLWQAAGYRPRRTVLLAAWGAQELGELGSRHYAAHPVWPLEQTVAMLQLDAVGGGDGYYLEAQGGDRPEGLLLFNLQIADEWSEGRLALRSKSGRSDQLPFREAGIPTLLITWRGSSEDNLPDELAGEIEPYRLGVTGRFVATTVMAAAR